MSSVSVVVLNYNKMEDLRRNLAALRLQTVAPYEIIVVDNNSSDDSVEMVKRCFPEVTIFEMEFNSGVSAGRNFGYKRAGGDIIVSLDDDSVCPPDTIEKTIALFHEDPSVGCLAYLIRTASSMTFDNISLSKQLGNYHGAGHAFCRAISLAIRQKL
jgi:GT2 family glycosyltransferase